MHGEQINDLSNQAIAQALDELADLVSASGENQFKARAYHRAAKVIAETKQSLSEMVRHCQDLTELPAVGESIAAKIVELVSTGHCAYLDKLRESVSPEIEELLQIPGLGSQRFKILHDQLGILTKQQLLQHCLAGDISSLKGFGAALEQRFIQALRADSKEGKRFPLPSLDARAKELAHCIQDLPCVRTAAIAGSIRRRKDMVGDLDILVDSDDPSTVMEKLKSLALVHRVMVAGPTKASLMLKSGLQVDVRIVPKESYGAALLYLTGSKEHNIALRKRALSLGLTLNEYGLFRGTERIAGRSEKSVYNSLGLEYIPAELRENRGEIEAAESERLPQLIKPADLLGDLHCHTRASDGSANLDTLVLTAINLGLEYIAITDHLGGDDARHAMTESILFAQMKDIDTVNALLKSFTVLKGAEVDVHVDGSIACSSAVLRDLDIVICSVSSYPRLNRDDQTARLIRVLENPYCHILAHPTSRLLSGQSPIDVDMPRIIKAAVANKVVLEINGHPARLDLFDIYCRMAKAEGALFSLTADVHAPHDFAHVSNALDQARRGWIEAKNVINTHSSAAVRFLIEKKKARSR